MKKGRIISNVNKSNILVLLLGGLGFILFSYFILESALSDEYIQIVNLILGGLFGLGGFGFLILILFIENFIFENKKLKVFSLFGKLKREIPLIEIESYCEIEKMNKYSRWNDLTIFTKESKCTISSGTHSNYKLLKKVLINGKREDLYRVKNWQYKNIRKKGIGFFIAGAIFILLFGNIFFSRDLEILPSQLSEIEGTLLNEIEIKKSGKQRRSSSVEIELLEYPKFKFIIGGYGWNIAKVNQLIANVNKGEKIKVEILTDQLQKKLKKEVPLNFWDKWINYRSISIYELKHKEINYFELNQFNKDKKADSNSVALYVLLGFSLFIFGYGIYILVMNAKPER